MKPSQLLAVAVGIGLIGMFAFSRLSPLDATPLPQGGPDLTEVFAVDVHHGEADAKYLGQLLGSMATFIERDGEKSSPRYKENWQVNELRKMLLVDHFDPPLSSRYPAMKTACGDWLAEQMGTTPKELDDAGRKRCVEAFRGLSAACERASREL